MKKLLTLLVLFSIGAAAQEKTFTSEEVSVNEFLDGTLYTPKTSKKTNLVILIAGSGPTDRDGNSMMLQGENNSLKYLAEGLAEQGISVYSYDKRFFGLFKAGKSEEGMAMLFDDFVDDAIEVANFFRKSKKYKNIIFAGHSEGSLIGILGAQKTKIDGVISLSGTGNSLDVILETQIGAQAPFLLEETQSILGELKKGNTIEVENPMLQSVFSEQLQPFVISSLKYNPQDEIKKLSVPVMIVNGTADLQIHLSETELLQKAKPDAKYLIVENMNHVLKEVKDVSENQQSYSNPDFPVVPELINQIASFVKSIK